MRMTILILLAALVISWGLTGCWNINAKAPESITVGTGHYPTLGQELTDLKKALDQGLITEPEYQRAKAKLIEAANKRKIRADD